MKDNEHYTILKTEEVKEVGLKSTLLEHKKTGAQILLLKNDDTNKLFSINFRTIPQDSTGVAHILEHSVLGGSEKYPVKDPFIQMARTSLNTYINAWTFPDKTLYPVSSENDEDLHNLISVYMDAVFHPLITEETLKQEGWHYEFNDKNELIYKGVVFNEMKGGMSNVDSVVDKAVNKTLFPGTTYANNSGGEPENIPDLTYENFIKFHKKYYHPTNAKIVLYGNMDFERELQFIDECLSHFEKDESVLEQIKTAKAFDRPIQAKMPYPVQDEKETDHHAVYSWVLSKPTSAERMALEILVYMLLETDSSELRHRILAETSCKEIVPTGLEQDIHQPYFFVYLKGLGEKDFEKADLIINEELTKLAKSIDPQLALAATNRVEFRRREAVYRGDSRALSFLHLTSTLWNYDLDPLDGIRFADDIRAIRENPGIISEVIQKQLLDNNHKASIDLYPDATYQSSRQQKEDEKLAKLQKELTNEELDKIKNEAEQLKQLQEKQDTAEDLEKLPMLKVSDLPTTVSEIEKEVITEGDSYTLLFHPQHTNGIVTTNIFFEMNQLDKVELQYAALLTLLMSRIDTERYTYKELSNELDTYLGSINFTASAYAHVDSGELITKMALSMSYLPENDSRAAELAKEILLNTQFNDQERIMQIVKESAQSLEDSLVESGHLYSYMRSSAMLSGLHAKNELMSGISLLQFLKGIEESKNFEAISQQLESVHTKIISASGKLLSTSTEAKYKVRSVKQLETLAASLPSEQFKVADQKQFLLAQENEAFVLPTNVNYVSISVPVAYLKSYTGSQLAINILARNQYLWEEIRQKGGAYGCIIRYNSGAPVISLASYRDPNIQNSIEVYKRISEYYKKTAIAQKDLDGSIISGYADLEPYIEPLERGLISTLRHLRGSTVEYRQRLLDELLATDEKSFKRFGELFEQGYKQCHPISIIGNEEKIKEVAKKYDIKIKSI
ncbi:MAG: insulinase family protein [Candidatus Dojkabacteria bacterium]|nr:MAG: insulinase family protein [Candidatus Dojkabacteria bacterium]